jgi:outer membrane protein TolC
MASLPIFTFQKWETQKLKKMPKVEKRSSLIISALLLFASSVLAQENTAVGPATLPVDTFMNLVTQHHPMAVKARLIREQARAAKLKASGNFDPKLFSEMQQKQFKDSEYFNLQNSGLEIPGWFGLKAKAGYELNDGVFLNNQNTVPGSGLWYGDVSWTLGRGLFLDERRAALKQARLLEQSAEFEVELALNQLMQDALNAYWNWYAASEELKIFQNAETLALFRFKAIRRKALVGDMSFIDTLEAAIQVQDRQIKLQKAQASFITTRNILSTYLWLKGVIPLAIGASTYPSFDLQGLTATLPLGWFEAHPALNFYALKQDRLDIDRRLNNELLKPEFTLNYKFLNAPTQNDFFAEYSPNNYTWGLKASFPLFLRKGRGEVLKSKVKLQENELELKLKQLEIQTKVDALQQELQLSSSQLQSIRAMVANYERLLQAENIKFRNGESSLFLVNSREVKYIDSRLKEVEMEAKLKIVDAKLKAAAGLLDD